MIKNANIDLVVRGSLTTQSITDKDIRERYKIPISLGMFK